MRSGFVLIHSVFLNLSSFVFSVLLAWTLTNALLAAVIITTNDNKTANKAVNGYMAFLLYSVAGLACKFHSLNLKYGIRQLTPGVFSREVCRVSNIYDCQTVCWRVNSEASPFLSRHFFWISYWNPDIYIPGPDPRFFLSLFLSPHNGVFNTLQKNMLYLFSSFENTNRRFPTSRISVVVRRVTSTFLGGGITAFTVCSRSIFRISNGSAVPTVEMTLTRGGAESTIGVRRAAFVHGGFSDPEWCAIEWHYFNRRSGSQTRKKRRARVIWYVSIANSWMTFGTWKLCGVLIMTNATSELPVRFVFGSCRRRFGKLRMWVAEVRWKVVWKDNSMLRLRVHRVIKSVPSAFELAAPISRRAGG